MRSKNTDTYESQNRSFRYTLLAILGVLIVVAILAYAMRSMNGGNTPGTQDPMNLGAMENPTGTGGGQPGDRQDVNVSQQVPSDIPSVDSRDTAEGSAPTEGGGSEKDGWTPPVESSKILKEFSAETPVYSKTLEQYVVHTGMDFEVPADTQVKAVREGTVTAVYEDDTMGITIEIDHGNGLKSKYTNLSTMEMVEEGDVVKQGQVISGVGNTALFETLDPEHLHFELWKDGQTVDPAEYF